MKHFRWRKFGIPGFGLCIGHLQTGTPVGEKTRHSLYPCNLPAYCPQQVRPYPGRIKGIGIVPDAHRAAYQVGSVPTGMESVKGKFVTYNEEDDKAKTDTQGQAQNVDKREQRMAGNIAPGGFPERAEHTKRFSGRYRKPCNWRYPKTSVIHGLTPPAPPAVQPAHAAGR